jgi:hypothetical protein
LAFGHGIRAGSVDVLKDQLLFGRGITGVIEDERFGLGGDCGERERGRYKEENKETKRR